MTPIHRPDAKPPGPESNPEPRQEIVLVLEANQLDLARAIHAHETLAALVTADPTRLECEAPCPVFGDLDAALRAIPATCVCFAAIHRDLATEVQTCVDRGLQVLALGPPDIPSDQYARLADQAQSNGVTLTWGGWQVSCAAVQQVLCQSQQDGFGEPVYLRCVAGGGGSALSAWWSAREMLAVARVLLDADLQEVWIAATRAHRAYHAVVTAVAANSASAQLVIAPRGFAGRLDMLLLGTGGLLEINGGDQAVSMGPPPPGLPAEAPGPVEASWLADFPRPPAAVPRPLLDAPAFVADHRILHTLRRSARCGRPLALSPVPKACLG